MEALTLKDVLDIGLSAVLSVAVIALWRDNQHLRDVIIGYLEVAKKERHALYSAMTARRLEDEISQE